VAPGSIYVLESTRLQAAVTGPGADRPAGMSARAWLKSVTASSNCLKSTNTCSTRPKQHSHATVLVDLNEGEAAGMHDACTLVYGVQSTAVVSNSSGMNPAHVHTMPLLLCACCCLVFVGLNNTDNGGVLFPGTQPAVCQPVALPLHTCARISYQRGLLGSAARMSDSFCSTVLNSRLA
jgi:hypothetical protein